MIAAIFMSIEITPALVPEGKIKRIDITVDRPDGVLHACTVTCATEL